MITNQKHKIFAEEYILSSNIISSYQKAYPDASNETARTRGHKLSQKDTIAEYIKTKQLEIQNARQNNLVETLKSQDSTNILKREKVLEMVSNVVKITYNKAIKEKEKNFIDSFNKSVQVLNKMEGYDAPKEIDIIDNREFTFNVLKPNE
jgi:urease gamma subunit